MHLLDTETIWALRAASHGDADPAVLNWIENHASAGLFMSALSLAELGIVANQSAKTDKASAEAIRRWIDGPLTVAFDKHVLAVDSAVARRAALLGYPHLRDGLVAATALEHGLVIATPNVASYRMGKVKTVSPWSYLPRQDGDDGDWRQASRGGSLWIKSLFARG